VKAKLASPEDFLHIAIDLAIEKMKAGEGGPFGAVIVKDSTIVGRGWNSVTSTNDPTAHAEVVAIRDACRNLGSFQLDECELYTSCEPCPMCLGAIYWARPKAVYFAADRFAAAAAGFDDAFIYEEILKNFDARYIPTKQILSTEGARPFHEWSRKQDRVRY
jgi:guanine deaminase